MNGNIWKRAPLVAIVGLLLCFCVTACGGGEEPAEQVDTVAFRTWQETSMISDTDGKAYPVRIRITGTTRDQAKIRKAIDDYNLSAYGDVIVAEDEEALGDLEYVITSYEVEFPADFPEEEYGIVDVVPDFSVVNREGVSSFKSGRTEYTELGQVKEIEAPQTEYDFWAGDTYKGRTLYLMVKEEEDCVLCQTVGDDKVYYEVHE